jgi:hypothetical protein
VKYTLLVWTDEGTERPEAEAVAIDQDVQAWVRDLADRGILLQDQRLSLPGDATTVRVRGGETLLGDGPFAETKEQIAGFVIIEAPDLDAALEIAASNPLTAIGALEVRPHWTA